MKDLYGDLNLAREVEEMAAIDDVAYINAMKILFSGEMFDIHVFTGGACGYAGNSPFTNTHGYGTFEDPQNQILDNIESFFNDHDCPTILSVASVCAPRVYKTLFERDYKTLGYKNVYVYSHAKPLSHTTTLKITEATTSEDIKLWSRVISGGFADSQVVEEPDIISLGQSQKAGARFFICTLDGQAAAGATVYVNGTFARLGGMATLPSFRNIGIQTALLQHRLKVAYDLGCKTIVADSEPGNNSQRNLERAGFKLAYVRAISRKLKS